MSLRALGWCRFFEEAFAARTEKGWLAARVAVQHRGGFEIWTADEVWPADVSGRFRHQARKPSDYPAVGDWVVVEPVEGEGKGIIHAVLPRRSRFSRTTAGSATDEQLIATNLDEVFVVESLGANPNVRRIERFLTLVRDNGIVPVVLLTKSDLCADVEAALERVTAVCGDATVLAVSCLDRRGITAVRKRLGRGETAALLGPSGVGKSTLINTIAKEESQAVQEVRASDQKGRHTTTSREMVFLPGGGVIIDTPGLRELQLWEGGGGLDATFADVEEMAASCRFSDCRHQNEPGCAVRQAIAEGRMDAGRLTAYHKLGEEIAQFNRRRENRAQAEERRRRARQRARGAGQAPMDDE